MRKYIKDTFSLFLFNAKSIIIYGFLYSVLTYFLFGAIQSSASAIIMKYANVGYFGDNTLIPLLSSPITWLIIVLVAPLITFLSLISNCSIIYAFNASRLRKKVSIADMFGDGIFVAKNVFKRKNHILIPYFLILMPFVTSIEFGSAFLTADIPGFILDAIYANKTLTILFCSFLIILICVSIKWVLSIPIFTIDECDFKDACKKSSMLMKGNKVSFIFYYVLINIVIFAFLAIVYFVGYMVFLGIPDSFNKAYIIKIGIFAFVILSIVVFISTKYIVLGYSTNAYFTIADKKGLKLDETVNFHKVSKTSKIFVAVLFAFSVFLTLYFYDAPFLTSANNRVIPSIAAHRGDSVRAPENSMPAFELAIEEGKAKWIELDVHQTKDGVIVVSHDDYLGKIGIDRYVHNSTYEELIQYDSGTYFSDKYKGLHLCTLKEALDLAKDKIAVQIEIKPTEYDDHIEEAVVKIIEETNSMYPIAVLSLKDKPIKRVKELNPNIPTIYCTIIASEGIEDLEYADWFSVEESSIDEELVSRIHQKNKKCFVWTINKKDNVQYLVDCGVDAILTDDPIMMDEALKECDYFDSVLNTTEQYVYKVVSKIQSIIN